MFPFSYNLTLPELFHSDLITIPTARKGLHPEYERNPQLFEDGFKANVYLLSQVSSAVHHAIILRAVASALTATLCSWPLPPCPLFVLRILSALTTERTVKTIQPPHPINRS
jgi:hypothetical protein